jgi:ABC-2 type transport system ATP-binding protein
VTALEVDRLVKRFRVSRRAPGMRASLAGLVRRRYDDVLALDDISFAVPAGEVVGFLGPNGAGKTTTLKCLSGLLHPTSGDVRVLGRTPHRRESDFLRQISLVMGQRNSLFWDLPALDAFEVNRAIYRIPAATYRAALDELVDLLDLAPLLSRQVRVLSLGERMRCELAGALLHQPRVLFLDEPTLGLDVTAQAAVRGFFADYNARHGATVLLTSHYMGDVTALAKRVIVIDAGRLRFDGDLDTLSRRHVTHRLVRLRLSQPVARELIAQEVAQEGEVVSHAGLAVTLKVPAEDTAALVGRLLARLPVEDVAIEQPSMEDVIRAVFAGS